MIRNRSLITRSTTLSVTPTLIGFSAALALAVVACDSGTQEPTAPTPAAPEASEAPAPADESAATPPAASAREGEIDPSRLPAELPEGVVAAVPEYFAAEMPVYPGAQPAQGRGIDHEGSLQAAVQFVTNDALPEVHKFYSEQMKSKGWTLEEDTLNDTSAVIRASTEKCKANVLLMTVEAGGSDIFVTTEC